MTPLRSIVAILLGSLLALSAGAKPLHGVVDHVTDGDTIWVRPAGGAAVQVRLQGLDAPEICQAFGVEARDALAARLLHRTVHVSIRARDAYERSVGSVSIDGEDISAWLVAHGYAWSAHTRRGGGPYAREEVDARNARLGLWATGAVDPREFRRRHGSCRGG